MGFSFYFLISLIKQGVKIAGGGNWATYRETMDPNVVLLTLLRKERPGSRAAILFTN